MKKILILCLVTNVFSSFADDSAELGGYDKCVAGAKEMNNMVVIGCSEQASDIAKAMIKKHYKVIYDALEKKPDNEMDALSFELSHTSWELYRDSHCKLAGTYVGSPMYYSCPMQLNESRAAELKEMADSL